MTMANKRKYAARALQARSGWGLQECYGIIDRNLSPEALTALIAIRGGTPDPRYDETGRKVKKEKSE